MRTYKMTQIGLLKAWDLDPKPLFEVEIEGSKFYATSSIYGEFFLGPAIPPPKKEINTGLVRFIVNGKVIEESANYRPIYSDILEWAGYNNTTTILYTITYRIPNTCTHGEVPKGDSVQLYEGMIFNVAYTGTA